MFQRCLDDGQYRQALGLALETHRMDIFEKAIKQSVSQGSCYVLDKAGLKQIRFSQSCPLIFQDDVAGMLQYAFQVAMGLIQNRGFRNTVLRSLVALYRNLDTPDYVNMCQCLIFLDDPLAVADVLEKLSKDSEVMC